MPNGQHEFWVTERVFEVGDKIQRLGETWVVTSVGETDETSGEHMVVTVRYADEPLLPLVLEPREKVER